MLGACGFEGIHELVMGYLVLRWFQGIDRRGEGSKEFIGNENGVRNTATHRLLAEWR